MSKGLDKRSFCRIQKPSSVSETMKTPHLSSSFKARALIVLMALLVNLTPGLAGSWNWEVMVQPGMMATGSRTGVPSSLGSDYYFRAVDNNIWRHVRVLNQYGTYNWRMYQIGSTGWVKDWLAFQPGHSLSYDLLYYQGWDNHLWVLYRTKDGFTKESFAEAPLTYSPNVAGDVVVDTGLSVVFYRGIDSRIYGVYWGGYGYGWIQTPVGPLANVGGGLSVDSSRHYVYYRGTDYKLWVLYWDGSGWAQAPLGEIANVSEPITTDVASMVTYYRSWQDSSLWAVYWSGTAWVQAQVDAQAYMAPYASASAMYTAYYVQNPTNISFPPPWIEVPGGRKLLYLDLNGRCEQVVSNTHQWMGDGAWGLIGGLGMDGDGAVWAGRSDGAVVRFHFE